MPRVVAATAERLRPTCLLKDDKGMTERIQAWQCIGCGKLDAPRPCIGVCQDRKIDLVRASDYDLLLAQKQRLEAEIRVLAQTTPRAGEWERSFLSLQERARRLLLST
jgi:hypothetical protein